MRRIASSSILVLCFFSPAVAQRQAADKPKIEPEPCAPAKFIAGQALLRSIDGVDLRVITPHPDGGVLIGGSVYANDKKGLILHSDNNQLKSVLIPKVIDIDDFAFTTRKVGWRLYAGTLYTTNDGGACWREVFKDKALNNLYFADEQHGWLTGLDGIIYHTDDGGRSWRKQNSGTALNIEKVFFVDSLYGWAIGKKAYGDYPPKWKTALIATHDGGKTWETLITEKVLSLRSFSFINNSEGWGIDSSNNIAHTFDGGRTWAVQRPADDMAWTSIFFINERDGWAVGDGILHTDDGGNSWKAQLQDERPEYPMIEAVYFTDTQHGWAVRTQQLLYTMNGGLTWETIFKDPRTLALVK